jgi:lipopolysaccharide transport system ATP-binding protein
MNESAIRLRNVSKSYRIWRSPAARLRSIGLHAAKRVFPLVAANCNRAQSKLSRDFFALRNVDLEVAQGEAVGIIGRNGSGKSTLLQTIAGTLAPSSGVVEVRGRLAALLELGSGFNPDFTGRENVFLNASILGLSERQTRDRFDEITSFADIGEFIEQPVKTYSSGMVVRLAFAVQVAIEPEILIIDEALAVGDEAFQRKCLSRLESLRSRGMTLLFVSHSLQTVVDLCDRCILLHSGEKVAEGAPKEVAIEYERILYGSGNRAHPVIQRNDIHGRQKNAQSDNVCPEHYDPNLKSSPINYDRRGAVISNIRVVNAEDLVVNNLFSGRSYRIMYDVYFSGAAQMVDFGTMIKTMTGIEIAGATTLNSGRTIERIETGECFTISYSFECNLLPATYFVRAGVGSIDSEGHLFFLHRIEDALMIKVRQEGQHLSRGLSDCRFTLGILRRRELSRA